MKLRKVDNPPNPYDSAHRELLEPPPEARLEVFEERVKSILSPNDSPDLPFNWSVNPYRGCQHGCAYCYARPYHEYLGYGAGTDFESKIVVKVNAAEVLRRQLSRKSWRRETINFCGITDCYQPLEASYRVTRRCLEVCADLSNPVAIVTKGFLVVRDADLLLQIARRTRGRGQAKVFVSIPFADAETSKLIEPQAPLPARRFEAIRQLKQAGVSVGVFVAPIIPGLTDRDIPTILERAAKAGAESAHYTTLRLNGSVEAVFLKRIAELMPKRAGRIENRLRDVRGGKVGETRFGERMRGRGVYWESIRDLFHVTRERLGLSRADCREMYGVPGADPRPKPDAMVQLGFDFT